MLARDEVRTGKEGAESLDEVRVKHSSEELSLSLLHIDRCMLARDELRAGDIGRDKLGTGGDSLGLSFLSTFGGDGAGGLMLRFTVGAKSLE